MEVKGAEHAPSKAVSKQLGFIYCLKCEVNPLPWAVRLALKQNLDLAPESCGHSWCRFLPIRISA